MGDHSGTAGAVSFLPFAFLLAHSHLFVYCGRTERVEEGGAATAAVVFVPFAFVCVFVHLNLTFRNSLFIAV